MEGKIKYQYQYSTKRLKTMSGPSSQNDKGSKDPDPKDSGGLGCAFLQAEEQFQAKHKNDWKVQKERQSRQNKPLKPREEFNTGGSQTRRHGNVESSGSGYNRGSKMCQNRKDRSGNNPYDKHNKQQKEGKEFDSSQSSNSSLANTPNKQDRKYNSGLTYTRLQQISAKDSTDIIRALANSQSGLTEFLSGKIKPDSMYLIIKILSKLTLSDWEENKEHVLTKSASPEFFKTITEFVTFLVTDEQNCRRREEMEQFFENLLTFFHSVMVMLPTVAAEHLMGPLRATRMAMGGVTDFQNITLNTRLHEKMKGLISAFEERKKEKEEREKVMKEIVEPVYPKSLGSIRDVPLFPRPEDIANSQGSIVPNKIKGPYTNVDHYLDVQFRLLREDFISPVRQGINEYRIGNSNKSSQAKRRKVNNIRIYNRVKFLKPKVIVDKVGYDICFDPEKRIKVKWEHSKRFIYGSLLLFTTNNFHTFFLATVIKRDLDVVEKNRTVSVILCDSTELAQDILSKEFLMAESEVYFEPYYNVLKALQKFDSDTFPMKRYFVHVENKTEPPVYTRNGSDVYTISAGENGINGRKTIKLFDPYTWPSNTELGFDNSQMTAFQAALTNDLVVIQGPPGTGKTYLGLKIAAALLENSVIWNYDHKTPMLIICYTNHALDQFLEGIIFKGLTNNIVRIGGRSKSELLDPFNLRERRQSVAYYNPNQAQAALLKDLKKEMSSIFESIKILQDNLEYLEKNVGIISLRTLRIVMREHHKVFFKSNDDLLQWLLCGVNYQIQLKSQEKLVSTDDKEIKRKHCENPQDEFGLDSPDFENVARLNEVLFDSIELEESDKSHDSHSDIRVYFTCTFDEMQKKIEEYPKLLETLSSSESSREKIQLQMREAKEAENYLKLIFTHFEEKLKKAGSPGNDETNRLFDVKNLNGLSSDQRWILYKSWVEFLKAGFFLMIGKLEERYRKGSRRYDEVRQFDDLRIVQQADVVGITTTTAARLQAMLRELKPKIVIVEEAAEVLEAHIVASLSVYCQHLILIGDHKQLRPSPADYKLGKDYHLDVSLFERLINNGIKHHSLSTQHRMRPEISRLLVPNIYDSLSDHPSTKSRPRVLGMDHNIFFMTHQHLEAEVDDIVSKKNPFEARMIMLLARHLLLQGYKPDEITVLTTYSGQMYLIKEEQKRLEVSKDLLVTVVDNFQGEESRIILLSLVRSNEANKIGFLKTENRVCVALSRARDGLYVIGNMDCLTTESVLWQRIKQSFEQQNAFGPGLVLRCETHRNQFTRVVNPSDFNPVMEGGCSLPCSEQLPCGHVCKSLCHVSKDRHTSYRCSEPCTRFLCAEKHPCSKKCYQSCDQCKTPMKRTLVCGHQIMLPCCVEYRSLQCKQLVSLQFPECGHEVQVECFRQDYTHCPQPCPFRLECGHACTKTCHPLDDPDHLNYLCAKPCARPPLHCMTEGHKCPLACFEKCEPCQAKVVKQLACGHSLTTICTDADLTCRVPCSKKLSCGHQCPKLCYQPCEGCQVKVEKIVALCGHQVRVKCCDPPEKKYCGGKCAMTLQCGHKCAQRCKDTCSHLECKELTELPIALPCGHRGALLPCNIAHSVDFERDSNKEQLLQYCSEPCQQTLKCEHLCSGTCGQCMQGRIHKVCDEDCGNTLICGHSCSVPCRVVCPPCQKRCQNRCIHSKCSKKCGEPCVPCKEPCENRCVHTRCTKKCGDLCNRKPCIESCHLKLKCNHPCVGFCGEPCPPCKQCDPQHFKEFFYTGEETEEDAKWVLLEDCKHVVEARILEHWLGMDQEGTEIKLKSCPKCRPTEPNRYISTTKRYMNLVKKTFRDIQTVKEKLFGRVEEIRNEREILLKKVQSISSKELMNFPEYDTERDELYLLHSRLMKDLPVVRKQRRKEIDSEHLKVLAYMVDYLSTVVTRNKGIWSQLNDAAKLKMTTKVNSLTGALREREKKISIEEIDSFNLELNRIIRYGDLLILASSAEFAQLKAKEDVIQHFKRAEDLVNQLIRYSDDHDRKVINAVQELKSVIRSSAVLTDHERKMIHLAMSKSYYGGSSAQGHWFKCPNGHIYTITECGGAMVTAKCPEKGCGALIGGQNHTYLAGQQLASEMDGAARPAWSSGNDMNNFNLDNLR